MAKRAKETYRVLTVRDLVDLVNGNKRLFPRGLDTKIASGDFECNDFHMKHEMSADNGSLVLSYEMHEFMDWS